MIVRLAIGAGYDIADRALAIPQFEAQLGRNALNGNSAALRDSASAFGASGVATTYDLATGLFSTYDPQTGSFSNVSNNFPRLTAGINEIRFGADQLNPLAAKNGETAVYIGSFIAEEAFAGAGASAASRRTGAYRFDDFISYADDFPSSTSRRAAKRPSGFEPHGTTPLTGTRVRPEGVPDGWRIRSTKGKGGVEYYNPKNPNESVRVMQGNPNSPYPNSQGPYVRQKDAGGTFLRPDGTRSTLPKGGLKDPDAHIPLQDYPGFLK